MKTPASKLTLVLSMLALGSMFALPAIQAASDAEKAARKAKKQANDLRKYDKNANGKLDPDEKAALEADVAKARAAKKKKSQGN